MRMFDRRRYLFQVFRRGKSNFKTSIALLITGKGIADLNGMWVVDGSWQLDEFSTNLQHRDGSYDLRERYARDVDFNDLDLYEQNRPVALFCKNRLQPKLFTNHKLAKMRF